MRLCTVKLFFLFRKFYWLGLRASFSFNHALKETLVCLFLVFYRHLRKNTLIQRRFSVFVGFSFTFKETQGYRIYVYDTFNQTNKYDFKIEGDLEVLKYTKNNLLACAINTNIIEIWRFNDSSLQATLSGHSAKIQDLDYFDNILVSVSDDSRVKLWNMTNFTLINDLSGHTGKVKAVVFVNSKEIFNIFFNFGVNFFLIL